MESVGIESILDVPPILTKFSPPEKPGRAGLSYVQQPEDKDNQKNGSQTAAGVVTPAARVRINRERSKEKQQQNNHKNEFQGVSPEQRVKK
jgi:hypothetical protein